jgi:hypothetical protein
VGGLTPAQIDQVESLAARIADAVAVFTSAEVVYGVTGIDVTVLPEYGVLP